MQINIGNIKGRYGFGKKEIYEAAKTISMFKNVSINGVMIIPPLIEDKEQYINFFNEAKKIQQKLNKNILSCKNLSMGMSNDYKYAINEGATHIRIGSALFGEKKMIVVTQEIIDKKINIDYDVIVNTKSLEKLEKIMQKVDLNEQIKIYDIGSVKKSSKKIFEVADHINKTGKNPIIGNKK